jgi:hypothetical protein
VDWRRLSNEKDNLDLTTALLLPPLATLTADNSRFTCRKRILARFHHPYRGRLAVRYD